MMNNLIKRTLTGILFVAVVAGSILAGSYFLLILFSLITVAGLWEFYSLMEKSGKADIEKPVHCFGGFLLLVAFYIYASTNYGTIVFIPYVIYFLYLFISQLYLKKENPLQNWAYAILGQVYIALPFGLLCLMPFFDGKTYQSVLPFAFFVFIWINDTGAYVVGSAFGRHKMFKRISPKKSWEGFFGGLILSIATAIVFYYHFPGTLNVYEWIGMALVTVSFGTWGDLTESLLKRTINIKDSGAILPGHGGILDRFDSVLLSAPACMIYFAILNLIR